MTATAVTLGQAEDPHEGTAKEHNQLVAQMRERRERKASIAAFSRKMNTHKGIDGTTTSTGGQ